MLAAHILGGYLNYRMKARTQIFDLLDESWVEIRMKRVAGILIHFARALASRPLIRWRIMSWGRLARQQGCDVLRFRRHGMRWTVFNRDGFIGRNLYLYGSWQFREIDLTVSKLAERGVRLAGRTVVNVGANIGTTAVYLAKTYGCHVLAIEPVAQHFKLLRENVVQNGLEHRISCYQGAVYDHSGILTMIRPESNPGASEIYFEEDGSAIERDESRYSFSSVNAMPIPDILKASKLAVSDIAFVWSDTQGCEGHVIRTGAELWAAGVPLVIEFWPTGLRHQGDSEILPLIDQYFISYFRLPFSAADSANLIEQPISVLEKFVECVSGGKDDFDILLWPKHDADSQLFDAASVPPRPAAVGD
jgi:FkbM family methyltransferase